MATKKSPFYILQKFISPKQCETIVDSLGYYSPDVDKEGTPIKMMRNHEESEKIIYDKFKPLIPVLEKYYGFQHRGTETITFEFLAEGVEPVAQCDSAKWINKKWVRTKDRDLSIVLFLSDYQEKIPFDSEYEVYGGKLEFLQHKFGFNPERGTLIIWPSSPHFINATASIFAGDLFQAKFHIAAQTPFLYLPENFPGNYLSWFNNLE